MKVAHCSNTACSTATAATIDSTTPGVFSSITIGADGLGLISYGADELKLARCSNINCTSASLVVLDSKINVGENTSTSIAIGADGLALIAYFDQFNYDLKAAHCSNVFCQPAVRHR